MLWFLGMLPGPAERVEAPVWLIPYEVLTSPDTGTWLPAVERGHTVAKGALIGTVADLFGNPVAAVRAPFDGEVMYVVGTPAISRGEPLAMIAQRRPAGGSLR
jgi:hypothetical protein